MAIAFDNALQPSMYQPFHDKFNFCKPRFCCKNSKKTLQSDVKRCVRSFFAIGSLLVLQIFIQISFSFER